jgi:hypothetical protein
MLLLVLLVANLVSAFQALGTLMAVGLMMLPAAAARFWVAGLPAMAALSVAIGAVSGAAGLLLSYHAELPSGPAIVLVCRCGLHRSHSASARATASSRGRARHLPPCAQNTHETDPIAEPSALAAPAPWPPCSLAP